jgi:hypothetical protein
MRAVALVALCSCGLTMTKGPDPKAPPDQRPQCTESMAAPKRDAIGAVIGLVAVVFGGVALEADNDAVGAPLLVGGLGAMVVSYASGGVGYYRIKKCRKAVDAYERRALSTPPP